MAIHAVLPDISSEAVVVVALPTAVLEHVIESHQEVEPSEVSLSLDYVPSSPIRAPISPDCHPGPDTDIEPIEDESEPIEDVPKAAEPASVRPSCKRCRSPPPVLSVPLPDVPSPRRRSSPPPDTTAKTGFTRDGIDTWRHMKGEPRYEMEEGSLAQIQSITGDPIHYTIPLIVVRLFCHDGQIEEIRDHQREVSVARIESDEQETKTLRARAMWVEAQVAALPVLLGIARIRIMDFEFRAEDADDRLEQCECGWIHDKAHIRRLEEYLSI
nr:hypothetical protein [Tanacetum cinerariifolium]